jgi:hypothetical protein
LFNELGILISTPFIERVFPDEKGYGFVTIGRLVLLREVRFKHQRLQYVVPGWRFSSRQAVRRNSHPIVAKGIHRQVGTGLKLLQYHGIELAVALDTLHSTNDIAYIPTWCSSLRRLSYWKYRHLHSRGYAVELHNKDHSTKYVPCKESFTAHNLIIS